MKFNTTLLLLLLLATASRGSAASLFAGSVTQFSLINEDLHVPGESPLFHCAPTEGELLSIEKVNLRPNPPTPGETLTIEASGILSDVITHGSMIDITVRYGKYVKLLDRSFDLCDNASEIDQECPIDQGRLILKKAVEIPSPIPGGTYTVQAMAYTGDGRPITCLIASVTF